MLGSFFGAQIAAWLGRRRAYALISAGATALTSLMFLGTAPLQASFLPIVFAQGFVATLFFGWLPLYLPELFPTRVRAAGSGIAYNVGRFATAAGALMAGLLFTAMGGSYAKVGALCGFIYLLGLIVIWWAPDTAAEYRELARQFNPVKFDAEAWVRLAQAAGMRYLVVTSNHHHGFAMYHSQVSPYKIVDWTPFKRDPLKKLAETCARAGIRFCVYYSHRTDRVELVDSANQVIAVNEVTNLPFLPASFPCIPENRHSPRTPPSPTSDGAWSGRTGDIAEPVRQRAAPRGLEAAGWSTAR
jgi:hypothetical protein